MTAACITIHTSTPHLCVFKSGVELLRAGYSPGVNLRELWLIIFPHEFYTHLVQTLTQPHHPKPPFQNARPLFIQGPYLGGWGWRESPQQLFPGEISIPCGLRPKCEEMRNVIFSLALIMSFFFFFIRSEFCHTLK